MKIALFLNENFSMWHFRRGLISRLVAAGHSVVTIVPPGPYVAKLEGLGARCVTVPIARYISPLQDLKLFVHVWRLFRRERFDLVHNMTVKPNIFGTFAAKLARVPRVVCLISGLGFAFAEKKSPRHKVVGAITLLLYRAALALCDKVWFQNPDDYAQLVRAGYLKKEKGLVILSGGINLDEYSTRQVMPQKLRELRKELGVPSEAHCIVMVSARMLRSKGIEEFIAASQNLRSYYPEWCFVLLCPREEGSPDEVPEAYIAANAAENLFVVDRFHEDAKPFVALADIFTLPSYYKEGVPRTLLEALAMEKPVVTTDHPGCREAVEEGRNGYLIPIQDAKQLTEKLEILINDADKRRVFGEHSRRLAQEKFSEEFVVSRIMSELYEL